MKIKFMSNYDRLKNLMDIVCAVSKKQKSVVVENITPQTVESENIAKTICHELGKHIIVKKGNK